MEYHAQGRGSVVLHLGDGHELEVRQELRVPAHVVPAGGREPPQEDLRHAVRIGVLAERRDAPCHASNVLAQCNQLRRAAEFKIARGEEAEVRDMGAKAAAFAATVGALVLAGPTLQAAIVGANLGPVSAVAGAAAGPFTTHFWAPMSKWLISGASFLDLNRPTDAVSLPQYTALTLTGFFFSRYGLLVTPINYTLTSVNVALFGSSAWHLGRKIKADFIDR